MLSLVGVLALVGRFVLAIIFLQAGLAKLPARDDFRRAVSNYGLLPGPSVSAVAAWLPPLEVLAALLLAVGLATGPVAAVLCLLLLVFVTAVTINLARGRRIECGCAGAAPRRIGWAHVVRNLALAAVAAGVAVLAPDVLSPWPGWSLAGQAAIRGGDVLAVPLATTAALAGMALASSAVRVIRAANRVGRQASLATRPPERQGGSGR